MDTPNAHQQQNANNAIAIPCNNLVAPPSTNNGPQIRSRITVVCAECKRLKLKCDRRTPCGSCTKRDTIARCIYSPAAAEKVDLHSLNNRLIQVESTLALITAGQTPPVFQSSYPYSQISLPSTNPSSSTSYSPKPHLDPHHSEFGSNNSPHHSHFSSSLTQTSISIPFPDLAGIWLAELDLGLTLPYCSTPSLRPRNSKKVKRGLKPSTHDFNDKPNSCNSNIKVEPSPTEIYLRTPYCRATYSNPRAEKGEDAIIIDADESPSLPGAATTPSALVHLELPPLSAYYPESPQSMQTQPQSQTPQTEYTYPQIHQQPQADSAYSSSSPYNLQLQQQQDYPTSTHTPFPQSHQLPLNHRKRQSLDHQEQPQLTPQLLALLPPLHIRTPLTERARAAGVLGEYDASWSRWDGRCEKLFIPPGSLPPQQQPRPADGQREKSMRKSERDAKHARARAIFFGSGGNTGLSSPSAATRGEDEQDEDRECGNEDSVREAEGEDGQEQTSNVPLFAGLCFMLSVGALSWMQTGEKAQTPDVDPGFLYALGAQAMSLWEGWRERKGEEGKSKGDRQDEIDRLIVGLWQVGFFVLESSALEWKGASAMKEGDGALSIDRGGTGGALGGVFPLIGKLVNLARALGFARDPDEGLHNYRRRRMRGRGRNMHLMNEEKEMRRVLWWDIMFYDMFISDALGHPPLVSLESYSTRMPASAGCDDDDDDGEEYEEGRDGEGEDTTEEDGDDDMRRMHVPQSSDRDMDWFGVRCRLSKLVQTIKHRIAHPGCACCGYRLDQAVALEADIRRWVEALPSAFQLNLSHHTPFGQEGRNRVTFAQSCELAIMANRLVISVYLPLVRSGAHVASTANSAWNPASGALVGAAQGIVRASKALRAVSFSPAHHSSVSSLPGSVVLGSFYPLDKALLDAVVVCAHAEIIGGSSRGASSLIWGGSGNGAVMEDVGIGLDVLTELGVTGEIERIVEALRRRVDLSVGKAGNLKRKHDQVEIEGRERETEKEDIGNDASDNAEGMLLDFENSTYSQGGMGGRGNTGDTGSMHAVVDLSTVHPQQRQQQPTPQRKDPSLRVTIATKASAEKDKKHTRKGQIGYPTVGIRVRPSKETMLLPTKQCMGVLASTADVSPGASEGDSPLPPPMISMQKVSNGRRVSGDTGMGYPQHQSQPQIQLQHHTGQHEVPPLPMLQDPRTQVHRHRSPSLTQDLRVRQDPVQPGDFVLPFGGFDQDHMDLHTSQRRKFSIHEQHHQRPPPSVYDPHQSSCTGPFDPLRGYDQPRRTPDHVSSDTYATASSPYTASSAPLSAASSPYASINSGGGPPPTPTFSPETAISSHQPSPQMFAPPLASPQTYYHMRSGYDNSYDGPRQQVSSLGDGFSLDTSVERGSSNMECSIPSTVIYGKPQQGPYDVKPSMDNLASHHNQQQHQQQTLQQSSYHVLATPSSQHAPNQNHHHGMSMNVPQQVWPSATQQQSIGEQTSSNYWHSTNW